MSNTLIINGAKKFAHSNGQLNDTLTEVADGTCTKLNPTEYQKFLLKISSKSF